ncbi:hypothetical protein D3C84_445080 [compost metagenome]
MLQCIADQVLQQLSQASGIPHACRVAQCMNCRIAFGITGTGFGNRCVSGIGQVHRLRFNWQALAQATAHQLQQIADHHRHVPRAAFDIDRTSQGIAFKRGFAHQHFGGQAHGLQGGTQVMAENSQEDIPRMIDLFGIGRRGFGKGFIDGFVETDHVLEVSEVR